MERPEARTKLGNCMIFMSHYVRRFEKRVLPYEPSLLGILRRVLPNFNFFSLFLFYFRLFHKNTTEGQLEQFKKYSKKLLSVVFLHPQPCFSSYSLVIYGRKKKREGWRIKKDFRILQCLKSIKNIALCCP